MRGTEQLGEIPHYRTFTTSRECQAQRLDHRTIILNIIFPCSQNGTLPDDPSTSKIVSNQTGKIPSSALKDYSSLSRPSTLRPRVTEPAASNSEHPGSPRTSSSFPRQSLSGPSLGAQPTTSVPRTHPPLVPTPDKPVRIRQPRDSQHRYTTDQGRESDEEEDEETDGEEQDEDPEPVVGSAVDSAERELVESRYSEINK